MIPEAIALYADTNGLVAAYWQGREIGMNRVLSFVVAVCLCVGFAAMAWSLPYNAMIPEDAQVKQVAPDKEHPGPREQYYVGGVLMGEREWYEGGTALRHEMVFPVDEGTGKRYTFAIHRMFDAQGRHLSMATEYKDGSTGPSQRWYEDGKEEFLYLSQGRVVTKEQYTQLWQQDREMPPPDLFLHLGILPRPGSPAVGILPRGAAAPGAGEMKLPPLTWPKIPGVGDTTPPKPPADTTRPAQAGVVAISSSPTGLFSAVAVGPTIAFGTMALTARLTDHNLAPGTEVNIIWRFNDGDPPLSRAKGSMKAGVPHLDNAIINEGGSLAPGAYSVFFTVAGNVVGRGQVHIEAALGLGGQSAANVYMAGLQDVQRALAAADADDIQEAGKLAAPALKLLAAAMASNPQLPDIFPVHQIAEALVALARVDTALDANDAVTALAWAERAYGHSGLAAGLAEDKQFKTAAEKIHQGVEQLLPPLMQAVAG